MSEFWTELFKLVDHNPFGSFLIILVLLSGIFGLLTAIVRRAKS
jgi:hypothetical protein